MSQAKNQLTELKSRIEEAKEAVKAEYGQKLKELSEYTHGLDRDEVIAIVTASNHHPYYAALGLQFVKPGDIVDEPAQMGRKSKGAKKAAAVAAKKPAPKTAKKSAAKLKFNLSDEKISKYKKFIGKSEVDAKEIMAGMDLKNPSNDLNFLVGKGLIVVSRKEKLKKFYKWK
jgi:hypothetical protein